MPDIPDESSFSLELANKLDGLIVWIIANSPCGYAYLIDHDLTAARDNLYRIATGLGDSLENEPEPSEGGAQYVNVTPSPWP